MAVAVGIVLQPIHAPPPPPPTPTRAEYIRHLTTRTIHQSQRYHPQLRPCHQSPPSPPVFTVFTVNNGYCYRLSRFIQRMICWMRGANWIPSPLPLLLSNVNNNPTR